MSRPTKDIPLEKRLMILNKDGLARYCKDLIGENQKLKDEIISLKNLLLKVGKENSQLQSQVREQYYTIRQYERGFDINSYEGDDERAG